MGGDEQTEEELAATKIQAVHRGKKGRKQAQEEADEQNGAATKIQAGFRGKKARKQAAKDAKKAEKEAKKAAKGGKKKGKKGKRGKIAPADLPDIDREAPDGYTPGMDRADMTIDMKKYENEQRQLHLHHHREGENSKDVAEKKKHGHHMHRGQRPGKKDSADKHVEYHAVKFADQITKIFGKGKGAYMKRGSDRSLKDCPMLCLFIAYWVGMVYLTTYTNQRGNIQDLVKPTDTDGKTCGEGKLKGFDNIFYAEPMELMQGRIGKRFCVKECPGSDTAEFTDGEASMTKNFICPPEMHQQKTTPNDLSSFDFMKMHGPGAFSGFDGPCYKPYGPMIEIVYQCVPYIDVNCLTDTTNSKAGCNETNMVTTIAKRLGTQHMQDIIDQKDVIYAAGGIAIVCSIMWVKFLDWFAGPLIWTTVIGTQIALILMGFGMLLKAGTFSKCMDLPADMGGGQWCMPEAVDKQLDKVPLSQAMTYTVGCNCFIAAAVFFCIVTVFKKRIFISIGVIEEASDAFLEMPQVIGIPVLTTIVSIALFVGNALSIASVAAMRTVDPITGEWVYSEQQNQMMMFQGFGLLWTQYVLIGAQYLWISGAIADWYFTFTDKFGDREMDAFPVLRAGGRMLAYNLGSVCWGALIITVVTILKYIAIYCINQVMAQSPENKIIKWLGRALICAIHCVDKFIRFLGNLAYIECAIYNVSFCRGIMNAAKRLIKNVIRFSFVTIFSKLIVLLGKVLVIANTVLVCFYWIWAKTADGNSSVMRMSIPIAPAVICGIIALLVAWPVMDIYSTAIDTIMMCFLEDEAENTGDLPSFATGPLAKFMSSTKTIADIQEEYMKNTTDAKTARIQKMNKQEDVMLELEHEMDADHKMHKKAHKEHMYEKHHHGKHKNHDFDNVDMGNNKNEDHSARDSGASAPAPKKKLTSKQRRKERREAKKAAHDEE